MSGAPKLETTQPSPQADAEPDKRTVRAPVERSTVERPTVERPTGLPLSLHLYRLLTRLAAPVAPSLLRRRAARGKEEPTRLNERLGVPSAGRPDGPLVWLHGASVGEMLMLLTLARALKEEAPRLHLLITTGTATSAALARGRLPADTVHQFVPVDAPGAVRRFLEHWRPQLAIFAESELWPNLILEAEARGIPLALINARMTERSLARWRKRAATLSRLLQSFQVIGAADARTAEGLSHFRAAPVPLLGNLKRASGAPDANEAALESLRRDWGERPRIWLAASTHEGEDEPLLAAHRQLLAAEPNALMILAPRHPDRGPALRTLSEQHGFATARRALGAPVDERTEVYIADTLGEMGLWLRLADATFIAGSLAPEIGGHTPLEACWTKTPMITGPYVANFDDVYAQLDAAQAVIRAETPDDIANALKTLSPETAHARNAAQAAYALASESDTAVLDAYLDVLRPLLPRPAPITAHGGDHAPSP